MKNGNYDNEGFKFFFVPAGSFGQSKTFPPSILFLFPHGNDIFETGIMILNDSARVLGIPAPDSKEIMTAWNYAKTNYPVFSDMGKK